MSRLPLAILLLVASPLAAQQSLTIYNDGRVLVRQSFDTKVPRGTSHATIALDQADPASVFPLDADVTITGARYSGAMSQENVARRAVGRTLRFVRSSPAGGRPDTVTATLLSVDPFRLKLADGSIMFEAPGTPVYPGELAGGAPELTLELASKSAHDRLRLGYFTEGASWSAAYSVVLDGANARVAGTAALASDRLSVKDADVQLLAGDVGAPPAPAPQVRRMAAFEEAKVSTGATAAEQRVGEFHLYSLPGTQSIQPGQITIAALFQPVDAPVTKMYLVRGAMPYWGYLPQTGDEGDVPVSIVYTLARARKTAFGDAPLPAGVARIYEADDANRLQLVGAASVDHTPAGENLRLDAGTAFDLSAKRVQTSYTTRRDSLRGIWRTIATADYRVTLANATDSAATVVVEERRAGEWSVLESSVPGEKVSSTVTRFRVSVPPRGEAALTYRVRAVW